MIAVERTVSETDVLIFHHSEQLLCLKKKLYIGNMCHVTR